MVVASVAALGTLVVGAVLGLVLFARSPRAATASTSDQTNGEDEFRRHLDAAGSLVSMGVVFSILFPAVGLVIGIILLFKDRVGPGLGCILLSVLTMAVGYALLFG